MKVLVVDDDPDIRLIAGWALGNAGHSVAEAATLAAALNAARAAPPDVILCDLQLEDGDGTTLLAAVRNEPALAGIQLVFLTGADQQVNRLRLTALGARAVLGKPFNPDTLAAELTRVLGE